MYGLAVPQALQSGAYQITAKQPSGEGLPSAASAQPAVRFAVNGLAAESDLTLLGREGLEERLGAPGEKGRWRWIGPGEKISLEGAQIRGRDYWKTLITIVLCGLVLEMLVLAWPAVKQDVTSAAGKDSAEPTKEQAA